MASWNGGSNSSQRRSGPSRTRNKAQVQRPVSRQAETTEEELKRWRKHVAEIYPDRHHTTCFLPSGYLKPVPYTSVEISGEKVRKHETPQPPASNSRRRKSGSLSSQHLQVAGLAYVSNPETLEDCHMQASDRQDKNAMEWVLRHLYTFAEENPGQVMMVISSLKFMKYLSSRYLSPCSISSYPRPEDPGEFDLIIIHRHNGLIVGEVKSVMRAADKSRDDYLKAIARKVDQATQQLDKQEKALQKMVSDLMPIVITVSKTLIMPNATKDELHQAMNRDEVVSKKLLACLKVGNLELALHKCLLKDNLTPYDPQGEVDPHIASQLIGWLNAISAPCAAMTDSIYDNLLARFCGPATEIEIFTVTEPHKAIKTQGQFVAETGLRLALLALYPSQIDLLHCQEPLVFISGPPGTGKTVVLALKGRQWLAQNSTDKVHVVSTRYKSRAVTKLLQSQLQRPPAGLGKQDFQGRVEDHHYNFNLHEDQVDKAVEDLAAAQTADGKLYVIVDEVGINFRDRFKAFCSKLKDRVTYLYLWAADHRGSNIPDFLKPHEMRIMLRCPPVIHKEIQQSDNIGVDSVSYAVDHSHTHTHGPNIIQRSHSGMLDHKSCNNCGKLIGAILKDIGVGEAGSDLVYRDVLIVYTNSDDDELPHASPQEATPVKNCGLVEGLENCGVPVTVLKRYSNIKVFDDVATAVNNTVVVSNWQNVSGLERRVVVGMGDLTSMDRFYVISRCTSQLIWINHKNPSAEGQF